MAIISQKTWDNMSKEEKEKICIDYHNYNVLLDAKSMAVLENTFGKENLQSESIAEKCVEPIKEYFDMQTQDTEWNKCSEQEQQNILKFYNNHPGWIGIIKTLEDKFGKHNLQPESKIKTWEDVEKENTICKEDISTLEDLCYCEYKIIKKLIATYKIAKLIELGYGGIVTEEDWKDDNVEKVSIIYIPFGKECFDIYCNSRRKEFITFHTKQQAEEFMSYPENRKLVEQFYML